MLLRANNFRKDKESDCRRNELESRIFVGRVFVDYAECLHFYPSFSYGRIIAGQYFDMPERGTYSTPHTVQFLGFNAVHRFVGVICNSPTKPMNL